MANVRLRFSIYSDKPELGIQSLEKELPPPTKHYILGNSIILANGRDSGKKYLESGFTYRYDFESITDIEVCSSKWRGEWEHQVNILIKLSEQGYELQLNYEIVVYENTYPSLYFSPDFLALLSKAGITLSFYYYND